MNNILIFSDLHINQSSLKECILILEEIGMLANKYNVDTLINLGDTFDTLKPNSSELDVFATFIRRLGNNKQHIILAAQSHESETEEKSILNHYGILSDNIRIVKEFKDSNHLYCGHFSIKESIINYEAKLSKEDFKNYFYVYLGHIHSYQLIKPNIVHLGSSRYVNFDEAKDEQKIVALITDYGTEKEDTHFLKLKSPIPMIQLELQQKQSQNQEKDPQNTSLDQKSLKLAPTSASNPSQIEVLCQTLDKTDPKTKIKIKILDFESFRQFLPLVNKYNNKFYLFKYETQFEIISKDNKKEGQTEMTSFKESFVNYLKNQKIDEKIKDILLEEIK